MLTIRSMIRHPVVSVPGRTEA